jgi:hypothetical protein
VRLDDFASFDGPFGRSFEMPVRRLKVEVVRFFVPTRLHRAGQDGPLIAALRYRLADQFDLHVLYRCATGPSRRLHWPAGFRRQPKRERFLGRIFWLVTTLLCLVLQRLQIRTILEMFLELLMRRRVIEDFG